MRNEAEGYHIKFTLDDDGRFSLTFDTFFSSDFYITVGPQTQIKTGFPETMFCVYDTVVNQNRTHVDGINHLFQANGTFTNLTNIEPNIQRFTSMFSLEEFDDRVTIDIIASLPLSTRVTCLNGGKPDHDYVLARFPISDYQKNASEVTISQKMNVPKNTYWYLNVLFVSDA